MKVGRATVCIIATMAAAALSSRAAADSGSPASLLEATWAVGVTGEPDSIAVDAHGNIYAAGATGTDVGSKYTARVQKLDSNGRMQWKRKALSADRSVFRSVAVDGVGNIYAAGIVGQGEMSFGNGVCVTGGHPTTNMVLVKYDSQGIARWARMIVNTDDESELDSVAVDSVGNVYAAGSCRMWAPIDFAQKAPGYYAISATRTVMSSARGAGPV